MKKITTKELTEQRVREIVKDEITKYMVKQAKYLSLSIFPPKETRK